MRISDWSSDVCSSDLRVVARKAAERAVGAEAGHAAMDEAREALRQHVRVAEAPFLQAARLEVLDQHVRRFEQAQEDGLALRLRDVEAERGLVAVDALEIGGEAVLEGGAPEIRRESCMGRVGK